MLHDRLEDVPRDAPRLRRPRGAAVRHRLARSPRGSPARSDRVRRGLLPAAFLPLLFNTLEPLIQALRGGPRTICSWPPTGRLFGVDVTVWAQRLVRPLSSDIFYCFYSTYYFIALTLGPRAVAAAPGDGAPVRLHPDGRLLRVLDRLLHHPGARPAIRPGIPVHRLADDDACRARHQRHDRRMEKTKFDVFPSGHTMISVAVLLVAWKRARDVFWVLLPIATGLIISTVYCRFHYVIDVIAGTTLAFVTVPVGDGVYDRLIAAAAPRPERLGAGAASRRSGRSCRADRPRGGRHPITSSLSSRSHEHLGAGVALARAGSGASRPS